MSEQVGTSTAGVTLAEGALQIEETTVGDVDGWMVTVGNIMQGSWRDANDRPCSGLSAEVGLYDEDRTSHGEHTVGPGAVLQIAGRPWLVTRVRAGEPLREGGVDNGVITLRPR